MPWTIIFLSTFFFIIIIIFFFFFFFFFFIFFYLEAPSGHFRLAPFNPGALRSVCIRRPTFFFCFFLFVFFSFLQTEIRIKVQKQRSIRYPFLSLFVFVSNRFSLGFTGFLFVYLKKKTPSKIKSKSNSQTKSHQLLVQSSFTGFQ